MIKPNRVRSATRCRGSLLAAGLLLVPGSLAWAQPCQVTIPPGAVFEEDPCTGTPPPCNVVPIECGVSFVGVGGYRPDASTSDSLQFTLTQPRTVTITVSSEIEALFGILQTWTPNPTGDCTEFTGFINPAGFPEDNCTEVTITVELDVGVWTIYVGHVFAQLEPCDSGDTQYVLTLDCGDGETDCNQNGIADSLEIMNDPTLDCFNPLAISTPHSTGGPDAVLDVCQCQANWNRDGGVNSGDVSAFLSSWLAATSEGTLLADLNCDAQNNSADISEYLTSWLAAVQDTVPHDSCP